MPPNHAMDYLTIYNLESYLFDTVRARFHAEGRLSAFDFFCIVIWKANRSKITVAKRLLAYGYSNLDDAVGALTQGLSQESTPENRLRYLWESWGFRLPMASAILTVLYPEEFTVYDTRVCDQLGRFRDLAGTTTFDRLWDGYQAFKRAVDQAAPKDLSLRDKDRFLWGKSFCEQLTHDVQTGFGGLAGRGPMDRSTADPDAPASKTISRSGMPALAIHAPDREADGGDKKSFEDTLRTGIGKAYALNKRVLHEISPGCVVILLCKDRKRRAEGRLLRIEPTMEGGRPSFTGNHIARYDVHVEGFEQVDYKTEALNRNGVAVVR